MSEAKELLTTDDFVVTKHSVWRMLSSRQTIAPLIDLLPASAYEKVAEYARELSDEFSTLERSLLQELTALPFDDGDEAVNKILATKENEPLLRSMLMGEDYAPTIWSMLEPEDNNG